MANVADLKAQGVERYNSAALEHAVQISTTQTVLFGFDGRNTDTVNAYYIMVFDKASAATGSDVPVLTIAVPPAGSGSSAGNGNFSYQTPLYGIKFKNGVYVAASSTDALTYTAIAANVISFHVQYAHEDGVSVV